MIQLAIHEAINGRDLDYTIARATMEEMMDGTATDIEMATLLTALRMKGETITEITACAEVMREKGAHIEPKGAVMDIVGTGGDEVGSFNISTTAAFVAAAGGVPVAKHGNRSVSVQVGRGGCARGDSALSCRCRPSRTKGCWRKRASASCSRRAITSP